MAHFDISQNYIELKYFDQISKALKYNNTIIGLHIDGNFSGAFLDPFGFMQRDEENSFYFSIQEQQNLKRIKGVKCTNHLRGGSNFCAGLRNCWICEGWTEQKFMLDPIKTKGEIKEGKVLLHLNFLKFEGIEMEKVKDVYEYKIMCPPVRIQYFYSNESKKIFKNNFRIFYFR